MDFLPSPFARASAHRRARRLTHIVVAVMGICASLGLSRPSRAQGLDDAKLDAMVLIVGNRGGETLRGSGFIVSLDRDRSIATILTSSHVIAGATFSVTFYADPNQTPVPVSEVIQLDQENRDGLGLFRVRRDVPPTATALEIMSRDDPFPQRGQSLQLLGYPNMGPLSTATRGYSGQSNSLYLVDLGVGEGSSGGPVLSGGKVFGVVTNTTDLQTAAVPFAMIRLFLEGARIQLPAATRTPAPTATAAPSAVAVPAPAPPQLTTPVASGLPGVLTAIFGPIRTASTGTSSPASTASTAAAPPATSVPAAASPASSAASSGAGNSASSAADASAEAGVAARTELTPPLRAMVDVIATKQGSPVHASGFVIAIQAERGAALVLTSGHVGDDAEFSVTFAADGAHPLPAHWVRQGASDLGDRWLLLQVDTGVPPAVRALEMLAATPAASASASVMGYVAGDPVPQALRDRRAGPLPSAPFLLGVDGGIAPAFLGGPVLFGDKVGGVLTSTDGTRSVAFGATAIRSVLTSLRLYGQAVVGTP